MNLWVCVVGDGPDERLVSDTEDVGEVYQAAAACADEVDCDTEKYFMFDDYGTQATYCTSGELLAVLDRIMED